MKAILLVTHGSKSKQSREEVVDLTQELRKRTDAPVVEFAFLDVDKPTIPEGIEVCVKQGATEITVLQNFLNSGNHVLQDIPAFIETAKLKFPGVSFTLTPPIGQHPKIPDLFLDLLK
jgi:sirohydrochlorin ferrochelatase